MHPHLLVLLICLQSIASMADQLCPPKLKAYMCKTIYTALSRFQGTETDKILAAEKLFNHVLHTSKSTLKQGDEESFNASSFRKYINDLGNGISRVLASDTLSYTLSDIEKVDIVELFNAHKGYAEKNKEVFEGITGHHRSIAALKEWDTAKEEVDMSSFKRYSQAAVTMGTKPWVANGNKWMMNNVYEFFHGGGAFKAYVKNVRKQYFETHSAYMPESDIEALTASLKTDLFPAQCPDGSRKKIRLLDVGSCYNPFQEDNITNSVEVIALDLYPTHTSVYQCDFLNLTVGPVGSAPVIIASEKETAVGATINYSSCDNNNNNNNSDSNGKPLLKKPRVRLHSDRLPASVASSSSVGAGAESTASVASLLSVGAGAESTASVASSLSVGAGAESGVKSEFRNDALRRSASSDSLIQLPAHSFDVVTMSLVLSYLPNPAVRRAMIAKARALLLDPMSMTMSASAAAPLCETTSTTSTTTTAGRVESKFEHEALPSTTQPNNPPPPPHRTGLLIIFEKESIFHVSAKSAAFRLIQPHHMLRSWKKAIISEGFEFVKYEALKVGNVRSHGLTFRAVNSNFRSYGVGVTVAVPYESSTAADDNAHRRGADGDQWTGMAPRDDGLWDHKNVNIGRVAAVVPEYSSLAFVEDPEALSELWIKQDFDEGA